MFLSCLNSLDACKQLIVSAYFSTSVQRWFNVFNWLTSVFIVTIRVFGYMLQCAVDNVTQANECVQFLLKLVVSVVLYHTAIHRSHHSAKQANSKRNKRIRIDTLVGLVQIQMVVPLLAVWYDRCIIQYSTV